MTESSMTRPPEWGATYHYSIQSFCPPQGENRLGMWGFSIALDTTFAQVVKSRALTDRFLEQLQTAAADWGDRCAGYDGGSIPRVNFWDDTMLLTNISVPGNACGLDMERDHFSRLDDQRWPPRQIDYDPHNVDTMGQAAGLLAIWLFWFEGAFAQISVDPGT